MNDNDLADLKQQFIRLVNAVKFGFCTMLFGISYFNIRLAFSIPVFREIIQDMLGGKPLPAPTVFVLSQQGHLPLLSIAWPWAGLAACISLRAEKAIMLLSILMVLTFIQMATTWSALSAPLFAIVKTMSGG